LGSELQGLGSPIILLVFLNMWLDGHLHNSRANHPCTSLCCIILLCLNKEQHALQYENDVGEPHHSYHFEGQL
jgi:hypothetical protein